LTTRRSRPGAALVALLGLVLAQGAFAVRLVGTGPLLRGEWIVQDDYGLHLANAMAARRLLWESGRLWGYHPGLMAGHPVGTLDSASNKLGEAVVALAAFAPPAQAFAWFLLVLFLLPPLCGWAGARLLERPHHEAVLASGLTMLLFDALREGPHPYLYFGMYAHATLLYLAPLCLALFLRGLADPRMRWTLLSAAGLALAVNLHALALAFVLPGMAVGLLVSLRRDARRGAHLLHAAVVVALAAAWNAHWIAPLLAAEPTAEEFVVPHFGDTIWALLELARGSHGALWLLGFAGLWLRRGELGARSTAALAAQAALLLVLGGAGGWLPGARLLQPARLLDAAGFLLIVPALALLPLASAEARGRRALAVVLLVVVAWPPVIAWSRVVRGDGGRLLTWESGAGERLPDDVRALVRRLAEVTSSDARIMLEDSDHDAYRHRFGYTHLPALLPFLLERELIGGPVQESRVPQHFADFSAGRAFGRPLGAFDDAALGRRLAVYNVGWVVAWSDPAVADLAGRPMLEALGRVGPYALFGVQGPRGFAVGQPGVRVDADFDRIRVTAAPPGRTVLAYHWLAGMHTEPPLPIRGVALLEDGPPLVEVENGAVADFVVRFDP